MNNKWFYRLRSLLLFWGACFFLAMLIFLFKSEELFHFFNDLSEFLQLPLEPMVEPAEGFWLVLVMALMSSLIYICFYASVDLKRRLDFVALILFTKFISTVFFIAFFITKSQALAYLLGAFAEGAVFISTYAMYLRVRREHRLMGIG